MDNKTYAAGVLALTAVVLGVANYLLSEPARAAVVIRDRDYQLVTAKSQSGSDVLYVLDNRTGLIAVMAYDPQSQTVKPRKVRAVMDAFPVPTR